jgi:DNA-directed RNA polymerase subunit RPC12/RpoP
MAIEKYYGPNAKVRFKEKEERSKRKLKVLYDDPILENFYERINELIKSLSAKKNEWDKLPSKLAAEKEVEVMMDGKYYGICPRCGSQFDYDDSFAERLVICRYCHLPMKLRDGRKGRVLEQIRNN